MSDLNYSKLITELESAPNWQRKLIYHLVSAVYFDRGYVFYEELTVTARDWIIDQGFTVEKVEAINSYVVKWK